MVTGGEKAVEPNRLKETQKKRVRREATKVATENTRGLEKPARQYRDRPTVKQSAQEPLRCFPRTSSAHYDSHANPTCRLPVRVVGVDPVLSDGHYEGHWRPTVQW